MRVTPDVTAIPHPERMRTEKNEANEASETTTMSAPRDVEPMHPGQARLHFLDKTRAMLTLRAGSRRIPAPGARIDYLGADKIVELRIIKSIGCRAYTHRRPGSRRFFAPQVLAEVLAVRDRVPPYRPGNAAAAEAAAAPVATTPETTAAL